MKTFLEIKKQGEAVNKELSDFIKEAEEYIRHYVNVHKEKLIVNIDIETVKGAIYNISHLDSGYFAVRFFTKDDKMFETKELTVNSLIKVSEYLKENY